jgi:tRNA(Arg) A34 adenosine deaminase TadA
VQPPWDDTFALAWASYIDGTTPVGAMLLDSDGRRVATGLNRRYSSQPVAGQLSGSRLAHAELNALAGVDPMTDVQDHTLYTTLEPCSLCVGASIQAGVGTVVYATPDPYGGAASMRLDNRQVQLRRPALVAEAATCGGAIWVRC